MTNLYDLGFLEGTIGETIVTTCNVDGQSNAAPMGVTIKNDEILAIRPYRTSLTYKNLQKTKCAVVNLTSNPGLFYLTSFKETISEGKLSPELFEKSKTIDAPRLKEVDAFVEVTVSDSNSFSIEREEFLCNVQLVEAFKMLPKVYCRARFATIEAIIHATRIKPFLKGNKEEQKCAFRLLELVDVCEDVVNRTAPDSRYSEIMVDLKQRINSWRQKDEGLC